MLALINRGFGLAALVIGALIFIVVLGVLVKYNAVGDALFVIVLPFRILWEGFLLLTDIVRAGLNGGGLFGAPVPTPTTTGPR